MIARARSGGELLQLLEKLTDEGIVYGSAYPRFVTRLDKYRWTTSYFRNTPVSYDYCGFPVKALPAITNYEEAALFFRRIREDGIALNSLTTIAQNSFLETLSEGVYIGEREEAARGAVGGSKVIAGKESFYGGRQAALEAPNTYLGVNLFDMPAAYLHAMRGDFPTILVESFPNIELDGVSYATATPIDLRWQILPHRVFSEDQTRVGISYFRKDPVTAYWQNAELRIARDRGYKIEVHRTWKYTRYMPLFDQWLDWAFELRKMPGDAGMLAKMMTTRLWSIFSMDPGGLRKRVYWELEDTSTPEDLKYNKIEHYYRTGRAPRDETYFVSSEITSRVRQRLLLEGLDQPSSIYCAVDSVMVTKDVTDIPGWKLRPESPMNKVEIKAPGFYRWQCDGCPLVVEKTQYWLQEYSKRAQETYKQLSEIEYALQFVTPKVSKEIILVPKYPHRPFHYSMAGVPEGIREDTWLRLSESSVAEYWGTYQLPDASPKYAQEMMETLYPPKVGGRINFNVIERYENLDGSEVVDYWVKNRGRYSPKILNQRNAGRSRPSLNRDRKTLWPYRESGTS